MIGPLHLDFFNQERYLLNNVDIRINLTRNNLKFVLMSAENKEFKIIMQEAVLHVRKLKISSAAMIALSLALQKTAAKYPIKCSEVRFFTVPKGSSNMNQDVITGNLPQRIIVGLVDSEAYAGSYTKNAFHFQHFGLNYLTAHVMVTKFLPNRSHQISAKDYTSAVSTAYFRGWTACIVTTAATSTEKNIQRVTLYGHSI